MYSDCSKDRSAIALTHHCLTMHCLKCQRKAALRAGSSGIWHSFFVFAQCHASSGKDFSPGRKLFKNTSNIDLSCSMLASVALEKLPSAGWRRKTCQRHNLNRVREVCRRLDLQQRRKHNRRQQCFVSTPVRPLKQETIP